MMRTRRTMMMATVAMAMMIAMATMMPLPSAPMMVVVVVLVVMAVGVVVDHDDGAAGGGEGPDISGVRCRTRCFLNSARLVLGIFSRQNLTFLKPASAGFLFSRSSQFSPSIWSCVRTSCEIALLVVIFLLLLSFLLERGEWRPRGQGAVCGD